MPEPWTCPRCQQVWQAAEPGRCPYCLVNPAPPLSALSLHGQPVTDPNAHPWQAPSAPASPPPTPAPPRADVLDPRYTALLQGVQRMLAPAVTWLEAHGIQVAQPTEAIGHLLRVVEGLSQQADQRVQSAMSKQAAQDGQARLVESLTQRIVSLEQGMQQLALAMTTQGHPLLTPAPRPETPYPTFLLTDQATARIEQAILDAQQVHGEEWRG